MFPALIDKNENIRVSDGWMLSKVQWMNKRHRPPPWAAPRVPWCKYLGFWGGCKDLKLNGQFYYTNDAMMWRFLLASSEWLSSGFCSTLYNVLESNNKVIKFQPTAGAYSGRLSPEHSGNLNVTTIWQIPFHPTLSTEKMRLFEYLQRLSKIQQSMNIFSKIYLLSIPCFTDKMCRGLNYEIWA